MKSVRSILKTLGIEKVDESQSESNTSSGNENRRKRLKTDSITDVIKLFNACSDSSSDDDEVKYTDEVDCYLKAKISYPNDQSLLKWWFDNASVYPQ